MNVIPASARSSVDDNSRMSTFSDYRLKTNNYFEWVRRGLAIVHQARGEAPWNYIHNPRNVLVRRGNRRITDYLESIYGSRTNYDILAAQKQFDVDYGGARSREDSGDNNPRTDPAARRLRNLLRAQGVNARFLRILGAGGNGLAALFDIRRGTSGPPTKFVVKTSLDSRTDMALEKHFMVRLERAKHMVQILRWGADVMAGSGQATPRDLQRWQALDNNPSIIALEYMKHGDLYGMVTKVGRARTTIPDGVLWKIFFCLARACIAMQHPPRRQVNQNGGETWLDENGPNINEQLPDQNRDIGYDLVHFDLDIQNVLIGDYDNSGHQTVPVFKASDFGTSQRTTSLDFFEPYEQHHKEWEFVDILPQTQNPRPKVAGNYGPASNIFAIGLEDVETLKEYLSTNSHPRISRTSIPRRVQVFHTKQPRLHQTTEKQELPPGQLLQTTQAQPEETQELFLWHPYLKEARLYNPQGLLRNQRKHKEQPLHPDPVLVNQR
ncbi:hypothetical protein VP1G_02814 [Cytospora mali]|uniref:Protein kinase domain-containing protein n=1 Tax=Cytospora mali TaxID=578113 RepID=A0A194UUU1_CYTMA|nr:hypothetical protein VP1G_02814 [Valsa mali var. pyri (nom. inval.)]